jgi:uncharacterized protein (TIGR00255 family)
LEVSVKGLQKMGPLERDIRTTLQRAHNRGRIDVVVSRRSTSSELAASRSSGVVDALVGEYTAACRRYGTSTDGLTNFLSSVLLREAFAGSDAPELSAHESELIRSLVEKASDALLQSRVLEGGALVNDIQSRLASMESLNESIEKRVQGASARLRERLMERVSQLAPEIKVDPERLALEVALLADRLDVAEELARLRIHLDEFRGTLQRGNKEGVGRKLDFLTQEIGRELNTIGSKAQDAVVQGFVVEGKTELERIREQVQNIE